MGKLKSRRFWMAIGGALASVGTAIAGMNMENDIIVIVGIICTAASVAIYQICESMIDVSSASGDIYIDVDEDETEGE